MAKALFLLIDNSLKVVEPDIARKAYDMLTGVLEPDEKQAEFLIRIKRIFLPPSVRPTDYEVTPMYETTIPVRIKPTDAEILDMRYR